jgi:hypothetical protein
MKKLALFLAIFALASCEDNRKLKFIGQDVIDGKVSAIREGHTGRAPLYPKIWVQTPTVTREVEIPFSYEGRWKVGDSCLLIIERYEEIKKEK